MTNTSGRYADFEGLREKAVALRREGHSRRRIRDQLHIHHLAWLRLLGVTPERLRFHVHIHESSDVAEAERFWARHTGADPSRFGKTSLKRHQPTGGRKNVGENYRGCLVVHVPQSAELYRRIEGWWYGIVGAASLPEK